MFMTLAPGVYFYPISSLSNVLKTKEAVPSRRRRFILISFFKGEKLLR